MTIADYSIDLPGGAYESEQQSHNFEATNLLIMRLQAINDILSRKESRLISENQVLMDRLERACSDFQKMNEYIEHLQESVNVVRTTIQETHIPA